MPTEIAAHASGISMVDTVIIVVYMVGIVVLGLWASGRRKDTSGDYFLAGRSLRWPVIGLALFATNISTVHLVGLASAGYKDGIVFGNFEWLATTCLVLLGLVFAPFYFRNGVSTLPEYLERRFSGGSRTMLAFMAVVGALFIHIGVSLYAGASIFEEFFGVNKYVSIVVISIATAVYTVLGGLKAVVVTEAVQTGFLLLGALIITVSCIWALEDRGITSYARFHEVVDAQTHALREKAADEARTKQAVEANITVKDAAPAGDDDGKDVASSTVVKNGRLSMLHGSGQYAWYAMLLGYPVLGIWYWCADQTIVQRVLGARTERDAQVGPVFAGTIKILPVFLMVFPGVMAFVLFQDKIGHGAGDADKTLPVLISELLPVGLRGMVVAGLLAALMSTVAAALNSASTLVSIDIVKRLRPETSEHRLVFVGRISAVVVMVLAMAWSTQGEHFGGIFKGLNQMISSLAPPITAVFLWGVFWRRGTSQAALVTLIGGFLLGAVTFVLDFPAFGLKIITEQWGTGFMLQAWWLFVICSIVFVTVSLLTPPPRPDQVEGLCWQNPVAAITSGRVKSMADPRVLAGGLLAVMCVLYYVFA